MEKFLTDTLLNKSYLTKASNSSRGNNSVLIARMPQKSSCLKVERGSNSYAKCSNLPLSDAQASTSSPEKQGSEQFFSLSEDLPELDEYTKRKAAKLQKSLNFLLSSCKNQFILNRLTYANQQKPTIQANLSDLRGLQAKLEYHGEGSDLFLDASLILLEPRIWYFMLLDDVLHVKREEAIAKLEGFSPWICKSGKQIFFPQIKAGKYNPYAKLRSSRVSASRRFRVLQFLHKITAKKVFLCNLVLTFPKEISILLFDDPNGDEKAWNCLKIFLQKFNKEYGYWVNLHDWKSSMPFSPHYHFHLSFPNFSYEKHRGSGRHKVFKRFKPFISASEIEKMKHLWCQSIKEGLCMQTSANVYSDFVSNINPETIVVHFDYKSEKPSQLHSLKYCTRSWLYDVADYFDGCDTDNDDCRFAKYYPFLKIQFKKFADKGCIQNRTRVFGFLRTFIDVIRRKDLLYEWRLKQSIAVCPVCGDDMHKCRNNFMGFSDIKSLNVYYAVKTKYVKLGELVRVECT